VEKRGGFAIRLARLPRPITHCLDQRWREQRRRTAAEFSELVTPGGLRRVTPQEAEQITEKFPAH
jgi:hypothetical protein